MAAGQLSFLKRFAALALFLVAARARAFEAVVDSSFDAQFYQVRSPFGAPAFQRERFTQTLGLSVYDLQGAPAPKGPRVDARLSLRVDADTSVDRAELDPSRDDRFVPGLSEAPFDLMYLYVEGRGFADGVLGFRAGRQYSIGPLGFWSFDGALVAVTTPVYFSVEGFGGFEQRGGLPLSTSRFEADGVWRGDRTDLESRKWPQFLEQSALAPAYGFNVKSEGLPFVDAAISYRKVLNRDTVVTSPFVTADRPLEHLSGSRTSTERVGAAANAVVPDAFAVSARAVYDFYLGRASEHGATLTYYALPELTFGLEYDYYVPTYDGDSIFNWFALGETTTAQTRASWRATRRFWLAVSTGLRRFSTGQPADGSDDGDATGGALTDALGSVDGRYRYPSGEVSLRALGDAGQRGRRTGGDASFRQLFEDGLYDAGAVLSLYDWADPLRTDRDATSFTYVVSGGFRPFSWTRAGIAWEHSMNRLVGNRFRFLVSLDIAFR